MYEWFLVLIEYIDGMVCWSWKFRDLRINHQSKTGPVVAGLKGREGAEHLRTRKEINRKKSVEERKGIKM